MGLAIVPNAIAGYQAQPSLANICALTTVKDSYFSSPIQTEQHIELRTAEFVTELSQRFFKQVDSPDVKALQKLLKIVSKEGVIPIRESLFKQRGYFSRLFSNESWKDWTDNRTPIGKVIRLYCDCVTSSTRLEVFTDLLDRNLLEVSNRDAAHLLKSLKMKKDQPNPMPGTFPASIDVNTLDGKNGTIFNGEQGTVSTFAGQSVNRVDNVYGDNTSSLIVGSPFYPGFNGINGGRVYVINGKKQWTTPVSLSDLHGANGYEGIIVDGYPDSLNAVIIGETVSSAGDINGDGIGDFIVSSDGELTPNTPVLSYVIFGRKGNWNSPFPLAKINGTNGFAIYHDNNPGGGTILNPAAVSNAGDFNGDNIDDIIIGEGSNVNNPAGWAFLIFGSRNKWSSSFDVSTLNGQSGIIANGENANAETGKSVGRLGDVNGDGVPDVIIGAPGANTGNVQNAGRAYILFGKKGIMNSPINLGALNSENGVILNGQDSGDRCGESVSDAGDVNGDGLPDVIIGAPGATSQGKLNAGVAYIVFGSKAKWANPFNFATLDGTNGVIINGIETDGRLGYSVRAAGDVNGDGIGDIIIGSPKIVPFGSIYHGDGKAYIIFGQKGRWTSPYNISALDGSNGFKVVYNSIYYTDMILGTSVAGAIDLNQDQIDDVVIGAPPKNPKYPFPASGSPGNVYVIFGKKSSAQNPTNPLNPLNTGLVIGLSVAGGIALSGLIALAAYCFCKHRNRIGAKGQEIQPLVN